MTESNKHNSLINFATPVAPEEYLSNKVKIAEAKQLISAFEEMNEVGKQSHDQLARELEQKIREGEQASKLLSQLKAQSNTQISPALSIQRPAIDHPPSTSRIEEVPNYDAGSGHSQQVQYHHFQGPTNSNQQTHNFVSQAMPQTAATSPYQQYNPQQRTSGNDGQSQQYSQYSQQPIIQNSSSRATSYTPFGFPHAVYPQQLPTRQDQRNYDNYRSMASTQEQRRVSSLQEPLHYSTSGSSQGQRHIPQVYSSSQTIPVHAPGPSSYPAYMNRPPQSVQQSSLTQNIYPAATLSQNQAAASGASYSQGPLPQKTTDIANQSQPMTSVARPVTRGPQPNASNSDSVPMATSTSSDPISINLEKTSPNSDYTSFSKQSPTPFPITLPSMDVNYMQFIRELRETIKKFEIEAPSNSYCDHPSNFFRVQKDLKGVMHIIVPTQGQARVTDLDQFCDWIRHRNATTSVTPAVSAPSQAGTSSISNALKAIPSTAHKANIQTTSSISRFQSDTPPQPGTSSSKQAPTKPISMHNQGAALNHRVAPPSTSPQAVSSASQIQFSTLPSSLVRPPPPQTPSAVSVPKTPSRQLSTIVNGVLRSAKQADKKYLASHILFGLGKRPREPDTSPTALTEPQRKRHAQQATDQIRSGVSPFTSYTVDQANQTVQKPNVPVQLQTTPKTASSFQQPSQHVFALPTISQETQQMLQTSSVSSGGQQRLVNASLEAPSTSKVAAAVEVPEVSETLSNQTPLSLQDSSNVPLSVLHSDPQQEIILEETKNDDRPSTSSGSSVPLAASSAIVQTSTLPSLVPLTVPDAVSSKISSGVNENITQPVASSALKQPQPDTPARLQPSFAGMHAQTNQPLFLPSPVSSPGINENDDPRPQSVAVPSRNSDRRKSSSSVKWKNRVYVLAPPRPEYLVKYLKLKRYRASLKKGMTSRRSVSTSIAAEEDFYNATESHSPSYANEQAAVQLACTRLQEVSCKWDGCSVTMNSVDALIRHLNRHHKSLSANHSNYFLCRWTQCGRRCNLNEKHLEKHASLPLNCPYEDCEETFRSAPPLWKHMRIQHKNDTLKPSALPSYPDIKPPDGILGVVPCYMITTREVNPDDISSARHAIVGPRVLRNIAGLARERSRNKLKKTVRSDIIPDEDISDDYDFLIARPTRYSSQLSQPVDMRVEDLDSENISRMVDEGLMLWGGEEDREHRVP